MEYELGEGGGGGGGVGGVSFETRHASKKVWA
jgi:hypothetical protein